MLEKIIIISLIISAIYVSLQDDMIFGRLRCKLERLPILLHKPLFECLTCMGGIYTLIIYPILFGFNIMIFPTMFCVIGLNMLIAKFVEL